MFSAQPSRIRAKGEVNARQMLSGQNPVSSRLERKRLQAAGNINRKCCIAQLKWKKCVEEGQGDRSAKGYSRRLIWGFPAKVVTFCVSCSENGGKASSRQILRSWLKTSHLLVLDCFGQRLMAVSQWDLKT